MNSFVHILEVLTLLLFCGLVFQIYRCNQNFYKVESKAKVVTSKRSISIQVNIPSHSPSKLPTDYLDNDEPIVVEKTKAPQANKINQTDPIAIPANSALDSLKQDDHPIENANDKILNEYIGEFFGDLGLSSNPDIEDYKDTQVSDVVSKDKVIHQDRTKEEIVGKGNVNQDLAENIIRGSLRESANDLSGSENVFGDKGSLETERPLVKSSIEELSETMAQLSNIENSDSIDRSIDSSIESIDAVTESSDIPVLTQVAHESDEVITVEAESINTAFVEAAITGSELADKSASQSNNEIPVLTDIATDSDDESIIVVSSSDQGVGESDKVMSDKVVHAMLDEAKLVCAS